jgi:hypothetical protein
VTVRSFGLLAGERLSRCATVRHFLTRKYNHFTLYLKGFFLFTEAVADDDDVGARASSLSKLFVVVVVDA